MNTDYQLKLTAEEDKALVRFLQAIGDSRLIDPANPPTPYEAYTARRRGVSYFKPEAYDLLNPTTQARDEWQWYLVNVVYEAATEREPSKKTVDTAKKRQQAAKKLKKILGHWPTAADLESTFSDLPKLDSSIIEIIDKDLVYLKSPLLRKTKTVRDTKSPATKKRRF